MLILEARPLGYPWSLLSPESMWLSMMHTVSESKGQGGFFCTGIHDYRLTVENDRHRIVIVMTKVRISYYTSPDLEKRKL